MVAAAVITGTGAPTAVGVGVAAPAAGLAAPATPVPSSSLSGNLANIEGIGQATNVEFARTAIAEGNRVGVRVRIGYATESERLASDAYVRVYAQTRDASKAGTAFHAQVGAQPTGVDRYFFGSANEVKTKNPFSMVSGEDMLRALEQVEGYPSKGPRSVTFFEVGSGNKYIITR
jgi:hypothetical protein